MNERMNNAKTAFFICFCDLNMCVRAVKLIKVVRLIGPTMRSLGVTM